MKHEIIEIGIAFELPFISDIEQQIAIELEKFIKGRRTDNIRSLEAEVETIAQKAGLYCGGAGSHLYLCRVADRETNENRPKAKHGEALTAQHQHEPFFLPRFAIICEKKEADGWAASVSHRKMRQAVLNEELAFTVGYITMLDEEYGSLTLYLNNRKLFAATVDQQEIHMLLSKQSSKISILQLTEEIE